jgi:WD40 repeat protein/serine/threonine protein kinase
MSVTPAPAQSGTYMAETTPYPDTIFNVARQLDDPAARAAYLDRACAGAPDLRAQVEALLHAHAGAGDFLEPAAFELDRFGATLEQSDLHLREGPGTLIGPYKLLQQIGEGGMGMVFLAEQQRPVRRQVALKVIKAGMDTRQVVARFESERQALALMDHPNIAKVFDAGVTDSGRPYFVMELVKGMSITKYCDAHHLMPRQRLELFVQVCRAIQHAHTKGIIHRDLKPSNVLVALYDGRPVPKVIDFGVAKATGQKLTDRTMFTGFGDVIGTLEYMSPEQAEVNQLDVDTRSDVYSLGVLLYELLTGSTPLENKRIKQTALLEVLRFIREEEPPKPSTRLNTAEQLPSIAASRGLEPKKLSGLVHGELDWIVMKALEKDRARRYETANGLAMDVQRYLNDEAVQACPPSPWYRFRKFARRNKRALASAAVLALAALVGVAALAVSTVLVSRANKELSASVVREQRAAAGERLEAYFQRITVAHRELSTDNLAAALRALEECPKELRGWEWNYLARLCKVDPLIIHDDTEVSGVAFSPDGERLASAGGDGVIKIRNSRTGEVLKSFAAHAKGASSVAFHPDGVHLASTGADGLVKVWDLAAGQEVFRGPCDALRKFGAAYTVAFSRPDGRLLAAGSEGAVRVWDWKKNRPGSPEQVLPSGHQSHSIPVAFSDDGRLATGGGSQGQNIWDTQTGRLLHTWPAHHYPVNALAFSPGGGQLATASLDHTVKLWDTTTGRLIHELPHTGNALGVAFSLDGKRLASTGEDKTVRIWDVTSGREVLGLRGHTDSTGCVAFSPDGHRLVSASLDGTFRIWDATPLRQGEGEETTFAHYGDELGCLAVSPNGAKLVAVGHGGLVKVWDAASGKQLLEIPAHSVLAWSVAWHPDGQRFATAGAGSDGAQLFVKFWDARNGQEDLPAISAEGEKFAVAFMAVAFGSSPDGHYLVTGKQDGTVQVWDARTHKKVRDLGTHGREIRAVVFSPDGKHLATASGDGLIKLWDAARLDQEQLPRFAPLRARVPGPSLNVAFSPDSQRLASGGADNTVKVWDVQTGRELQTLRGHTGDVYAVAFSPEDGGRWIASGSEDSTVKVWDTRTEPPVLVRSFRGHTSLVCSLAFSPDGKRLYSGSRDTTVKVWDVSSLDRAAAPTAGGK